MVKAKSVIVTLISTATHVEPLPVPMPERGAPKFRRTAIAAVTTNQPPPKVIWFRLAPVSTNRAAPMIATQSVRVRGPRTSLCQAFSGMTEAAPMLSPSAQEGTLVGRTQYGTVLVKIMRL